VAVADAAIQGMADLQRAVAWLRAKGSPRLGMMGFSLGGGMAAMMAAVDPDLACVAAMAPVADVGPCLLGSALTRGTIRRDLEASALHDGLFDRACEFLSPTAHPAVIPAERLLVVGSRHDVILPPSCFAQLAEHWRCALWDEPHGHITLFLSRRHAHRVIRWVTERMLA
jgi:dienelactone hydrolase